MVKKERLGRTLLDAIANQKELPSYTISIAGAAGSGFIEFAELIKNTFGEALVKILYSDRYYINDAIPNEALHYNLPLPPGTEPIYAIDYSRLLEDLQNARKKYSIVVVTGQFALSFKSIFRESDLKIFISVLPATSFYSSSVSGHYSPDVFKKYHAQLFGSGLMQFENLILPGILVCDYIIPGDDMIKDSWIEAIRAISRKILLRGNPDKMDFVDSEGKIRETLETKNSPLIIAGANCYLHLPKIEESQNYVQYFGLHVCTQRYVASIIREKPITPEYYAIQLKKGFIRDPYFDITNLEKYKFRPSFNELVSAVYDIFVTYLNELICLSGGSEVPEEIAENPFLKNFLEDVPLIHRDAVKADQLSVSHYCYTKESFVIDELEDHGNKKIAYIFPQNDINVSRESISIKKIWEIAMKNEK